MDTVWAHASEIAEAVAGGDVSAVEVTEATLARIARRDPELNAFTAVLEVRALARAEDLDNAHTEGRSLGPLDGVPFAVKNLFDIAGLPTLAGSKINRDAPPARRDATLIERLEAAGAVLLGALNMGEYAYDFTGENIHDGPSRNRSAPTPTARSGCQPRSAACSGSSRPTAGCRGHGPFRSWRASIMSGRWRARRRTSHSPMTPCRATMAMIRSAPIARPSR